MSIYSIKDLEKLSGIKAHTIRIWEQRYNIFEPKRTATNIRLYSDDDLKKLLNVSILNHNGYKISKISLLSEALIREMVEELSAQNPSFHTQIESLIVAMLELDEPRFLKVLENSISTIGFDDTVEKLLFPFLERIGLLWLSGSVNPAQEHFMSNLIRQKMIAAIDRESIDFKTGMPRIVFYLPEGEYHEIGLLYYAYLARKSGCETIYLGASVPHRDLLELESIKPTQFYFTAFVTSMNDEVLQGKLERLSSDFPKCTFFVTGWLIKEKQPKLPKKFMAVSSSYEFKKMLASVQDFPTT